MVMRDREVAAGTLRWVTSDEIGDWRKKKVADLTNNDGRQIVVEDSYSTDKSIDQVDTFVGEAPAFEKQPLDPRSGRETAEIMSHGYAEQLLELRRRDPEAFWRKVEQLRAATGSRYAMWSDEELAQRMVEVCRAAVIEPVVQRAYERQGRGGGWRETQL